MNKLKNMICYLCGPIDCAKDLGIGWRRKITPYLKEMGMIVIDPTNKPIKDFDEIESIEYRKQLKKNKQYDVLCTQMRKLRSYDLRCIDLSSLCIVYLDKEISSCGTWDEFFTANKEKKPCLVFCKQGKNHINDWVFGTVPPEYIYEDLDELIEYLKGVDSGEITPSGNRWVFFDWDKIIKGY